MVFFWISHLASPSCVYMQMTYCDAVSCEWLLLMLLGSDPSRRPLTFSHLEALLSGELYWLSLMGKAFSVRSSGNLIVAASGLPPSHVKIRADLRQKNSLCGHHNLSP